MGEFMYRVIVVDDEFIIRKALERVIKWEDFGFTFEGSFSTGNEALEYIKSHEVHLVITDICMPVMDGLELCKHIRNFSSDIKIVILTGYDDFNYAKKAITYNVWEYISKPITPNEFNELLHKVRLELDLDLQKKELINETKGLEQVRIYEQAQAVKDFLEESDDVDIKHSNLRRLSVSIYLEKYFSVVIKMMDVGNFQKSNNPVAIKRLSIYSAFNIISEKLANYSSLKPFLLNRDFVVIFASYNSSRSKMVALIKEVVELVYEILGIKILTGLGREYTSPLGLKDSYRNALKSIEVVDSIEDRKPEIFDMQKTGGENLTTIKDAIKFINENYTNPNLNLSDVCNAVAMSVSSFSRLYKEVTGETFVSTLTKVRIEKAKELLSFTNKKTYEIAAEVGFSDSHYFGITFKKFTNMTTSAYRKETRHG